jgi:FtsH-binding integral membrane protein
MSYIENYAAPHIIAAQAPADARASFIRRTYLHLAGAILAFIGIEFALLSSPLAEGLVQSMVGSQYGWLLVLGMFMGVGWVADRWARSSVSPGMQYAGLGLYVVAEALVFLPLLYVATYYSDATVIPTAGVLTLTLFGGLTALAFTSRIDFSFMAKALMIFGFVAMGAIVAGILFGFTLGLFFSVAMVGLSGGYILYTTSQIMFHYRTDQHVAASLSLFASVALMFYYVLRIVMSMSRD